MRVDTIRVSGTPHDKRVKLTITDKMEIIRLHSDGVGIRALSRDYGVSRRLIQFVLFPERLEAVKQHRADRGGTMQYYDKTKHRVYMQTHRDHKRNTLVAPHTNFTQEI